MGGWVQGGVGGWKAHRVGVCVVVGWVVGGSMGWVVVGWMVGGFMGR